MREAYQGKNHQSQRGHNSNSRGAYKPSAESNATFLYKPKTTISLTPNPHLPDTSKRLLTSRHIVVDEFVRQPQLIQHLKLSPRVLDGLKCWSRHLSCSLWLWDLRRWGDGRMLSYMTWGMSSEGQCNGGKPEKTWRQKNIFDFPKWRGRFVPPFHGLLNVGGLKWGWRDGLMICTRWSRII